MNPHTNPPTIEEIIECVEGGDLVKSAELCRTALDAAPEDANALTLAGVIHQRMGSLQFASQFFRRAMEINNQDPAAYYNYGNILKESGEAENARTHYRKAISCDPNFAPAYYGLGIIGLTLKQYDEAISNFNEALSRDSTWQDCYVNRGNAYYAKFQLDLALADYVKAIALNPSNAAAYMGRALVKQKTSPAEALVDFNVALTLEPNNPFLLNNFSEFLFSLFQFKRAADLLERLFKLCPKSFNAPGQWLHAKMHCCDWSNYENLQIWLTECISQGSAVARPFGLMAISKSEAELQAAARIYSTANYPANYGTPTKRLRPLNAKIRVGYLSGEFRQQAISILMTGVFASHNRDRFEIFAFDSGWDDGSELRKRQGAAFSEIVDISQMDDLAASHEIAAKQIDILIDLNGFFGKSRQGVLALKPCPIQIGYLGCPGTMGASYMDYLIADSAVIPETSSSYYDEKIIRMPHSYYPVDDQRVMPEQKKTRAQEGLPENGFVFCCFNNNYKITPTTFSQWMRILKGVEHSVLWLYKSCPDVVVNLRAEAIRNGVSPERLIFAEHVPEAEHLARHYLADLSLDTLPYNAHTTAVDALWMGLPLITLTGMTFPGRVASSLLLALELPELIATTPAEYESRAIELALDSKKLNKIKEKLIVQRKASPLFKTEMFTRHLEQGLAAIFERYHSGLSPESMAIKK